MKYICTFIIIALSFLYTGLNAQKLADKSIYYKFMQLPSYPLGVEKYDYVVYQNGETPEQESAVEQNKAALRSGYETDIKLYYDRVFEIDNQIYEIGTSKDLSLIKKQIKMGEVHNTMPEKPARPSLGYEEEMELYALEMDFHNAREDSLNKQEIKMIFKEQLRVLINETIPLKPSMSNMNAGAYRLPDALVAKIFVLDGLERVYDEQNKTRFEIALAEFEVKEKKEKGITEISGNANETVVEYRRIAGYKVYDQNNVMIDEGIIPATEDWRKEEFGETVKRSEIDKKIKAFEKNSAESSLYSAKYFLANKFAYATEQRNFELGYAKGKNHDYSQLTKAYETSFEIFETALTKENPDLSVLKEAIEIWESELKTADYTNKKARISAQIAVGLYFNIIESSIWLNDFDKAYTMLDELAGMDGIKSKTERKIKYSRQFIEDRQKRFEANNNLVADN
ncbi:hypothetical protein [Carboxylicivirga sp. RSCT41]|uniref:hypothetical protein n=1 Tax=Carboxylicivirga agarovorans TaxID=3417570 RepID=UPI003D327EF5